MLTSSSPLNCYRSFSPTYRVLSSISLAKTGRSASNGAPDPERAKAQGRKIDELADEYGLSPGGIRKILYGNSRNKIA